MVMASVENGFGHDAPELEWVAMEAHELADVYGSVVRDAAGNALDQTSYYAHAGLGRDCADDSRTGLNPASTLAKRRGRSHPGVEWSRRSADRASVRLTTRRTSGRKPRARNAHHPTHHYPAPRARGDGPRLLDRVPACRLSRASRHARRECRAGAPRSGSATDAEEHPRCAAGIEHLAGALSPEARNDPHPARRLGGVSQPIEAFEGPSVGRRGDRHLLRRDASLCEARSVGKLEGEP